MAGYLTYHCKKCGAAIPHKDILDGLAHVLANENAAICSECVRTPAGGADENQALTPGVPSNQAVSIDQMETQDAPPVEIIAPSPSRRPRSSARMPAVSAPPPASPRTVMFSLIAGGVMVLAAGIIF